jgi:hypothetical protein
MTDNSLALRGNSTIRTMDDVERAAMSMAKSGYFQDSREMAQAVVKILAGQEMGFGPFASMTGVYIISGRPSIGANLMAAAVKKSGRYNYRVTEMTEKNCSITFYEGGQEIGISVFSLEDAKKAGTKNLDKYARNMLFARAISNGVRWFCPDVFNGSAFYTPEELGANVNEDGEMIDAIIVPAPKAEAPIEQPTPTTPPAQEWDSTALMTLCTEYILPKSRLINTLQYCKLDRPSNAEQLSKWMAAYKIARDSGATPAEAGKIANDATID